MKRVHRTPMARGKTLAPFTPPAGASPLQVAVARRLRDEMARQGIRPKELADRSGVSPGIIYTAVHATKEPLLTSLAEIARGLGKSLAWLTEGVVDLTPTPAKTVPIRGDAHMGVWRPMALQEEPHGEAADVVPKDERYRDFPREGRLITDDELMGLDPPVPRGSVAIWADLSKSDLAIESGIYLVFRHHEGTVQRAFWRLAAYRDRYELTPVTPGPDAPAPLTLSREELEKGEAVSVAGILVATHTETVSGSGNPVTTTVRYR